MIFFKAQKKLNADLIFQEKFSRKEYLLKEKEKNLEYVQNRINSKFLHSHLKKNSLACLNS